MYDSLFESLCMVPDPWIERKKVYPLDFLLLIVFLSTLSGNTSWYEIEDYAEEYEEELKSLYEKLTGHQLTHTMPSHDTLNRSISLLDVEAFEGAYKRWIEGFISATSGKHICIDGKTMRGVKKLSFDTQSQVVSAFSPQDMCSLAQLYFCPLFQKHILLDEQTELSHGRIETRRYESILNPLEIEANEVLTRWKGLRSIHKVVRKRRDKKSDKTSEEAAYYISSLTDLSSLKQAIRGHWAIENKLHHCLDVYFGHDASHKRTRNVAQIMDIIQKINLLIIERLKTNMKSSIPRIQKKLARMKPQQLMTI